MAERKPQKRIDRTYEDSNFAWSLMNKGNFIDGFGIGFGFSLITRGNVTAGVGLIALSVLTESGLIINATVKAKKARRALGQ